MLIFQREEEYFPFLGAFDRCYNPAQHNDRHEDISTNICVNELRNKPEVECTHLFTTGKAWMGYILAIITEFRDISRPLTDVDFTINLTQGENFIGRF